MMEQPSLGFDEEEPEATTFSVVELNSRVRDALRRGFPDEVWVRGEVQNLSRSGAGPASLRRPISTSKKPIAATPVPYA